MIQVYHDIPYIYIHRYIMIYLMYTYIPMSMLQNTFDTKCRDRVHGDCGKDMFLCFLSTRGNRKTQDRDVCNIGIWC